MFSYFSEVSLDGLEPIMLDETWGLSNHTTKYSGIYSRNGYQHNRESTSDIANSIRKKYGKSNLKNLEILRAL